MSEHASELRESVRRESYCTEPGCEYLGKPSVQGHCFHVLDDATDRYIAKLEALAERELAFYRERYQGEAYVQTLEAMFTCATMNWHSGLDEMIRLRRENAALRAGSTVPHKPLPEQPSERA